MARCLLIVFVLATVLAACGGSEPPTVGTPKTFATACDKANNGQRIALTGYLRFPESFTGNASVVFRLYEQPDMKGTPIGVQMSFGSQPNQAAPVSNHYTDEDIKVHLANGQTAGFKTKVNVSGGMYVPTVSQDFPCALENPLVEAAT